MNSIDEQIHVLHVDDEPGLADLAATFLEREDDRFNVEFANDASDGLALLAEEDFDCVISDYDMPGKNGIEFLKTVREEYPDLPFILYTGKGSEEVASEAITAGVTDYLQKESSTDHYKLLANRTRNAVVQSRAQQQASAVEQQLQDLSQVSNDILWMFTHDWTELLYINPPYEKIWGRPTETLEDDPKDFLEGVHPDDRDSVETAMQQVSNGETVDIEFRVNADEAYQRWVWAQGFPLTDESGDVTRVAGFVRDITNRKERVQELELKTRAMEEAPVGITISDPSREDNPIIYANDRFEELTGYSTTEIMGKNCRFLQGEETSADHVAAMRQAITNEESVTVELRNYRKDGELFWNRVTIAPVTDEQGDVKNFVGFQEDVTQRKLQEAAGEATFGYLQGLYDIATDTELESNEKITRLLRLGPETLDLPYGFVTRIETDGPNEGEGVQRVVEASGNHELLQPESSAPLSEAYCRKTIQTEGVFEIENAIESGWEGDPAYELFNLGSYIGTSVKVNGEIYGTVFFASTDPRGEPFSEAERTFVQLLSRLVSYELEQTEATRTLEQQNERLDEFARVVSHDLKNPLSVAHGNIQLASEDCDSDHLDTAEGAIERSLTLVDELLEVARKGETVTNRDHVELESLAKTCWQNVQTADASLVTTTNTAIRANRSRLQQLLENLYKNAVEHGGDDVTVTIGDLADGFFIADDGQGIADESAGDIFQPGYSTSEDGTGIGLAIVTQIVADHGWEIAVTDSADGGARFEVTGVEFVDQQ